MSRYQPSKGVRSHKQPTQFDVGGARQISGQRANDPNGGAALWPNGLYEYPAMTQERQRPAQLRKGSGAMRAIAQFLAGALQTS